MNNFFKRVAAEIERDAREAAARRVEPADEGDFRFEIGEMDEDGCRRITMIDDRGEIVESYTTTDDPYAHVAQFRECQETSFEERYAPFGPEWEREQEVPF